MFMSPINAVAGACVLLGLHVTKCGFSLGLCHIKCSKIPHTWVSCSLVSEGSSELGPACSKQLPLLCLAHLHTQLLQLALLDPQLVHSLCKSLLQLCLLSSDDHEHLQGLCCGLCLLISPAQAASDFFMPSRSQGKQR